MSLVPNRLLILTVCWALIPFVPGFSLPAGIQTDGQSAGPGPVVAVGGGGLPDGLFKNMIEMAGGPAIRVVVLPQASQLEDRGQDAAQEFRTQGAANVDVVEFDNPEEARKKIEQAGLIWFSGGDQSRLIAALQEASLVQAVLERHRAGAVIGGTSAGAAVMSELMITDSPDKHAIRSGNTPMATGLGLTPGMIVDQHFVERQRLNRLLSAVLDHPDRIGVGISEKTAIIVRSGLLQVVGAGSVIILDARSATVEKSEPGTLQTGREIRTHILHAGQEIQLLPVSQK